MLFKLKFFEIKSFPTERKYPGSRTLVTHEHRSRIGRCLFHNLDNITFDNPTLESMCLAPLAANLAIMDTKNRLSRRSEWGVLDFHYYCPFIRGLGSYLYDFDILNPDDDLPNIYEELRTALKAAVPGRHLKVVTMETHVYVVSSVSDPDQFINNVRNLHRRLSNHVLGVTKVSISHPKKSLRDASIGDSLELLTMRLRQRMCAICHGATDDILSERRITCLPCSHLYHEECITLCLMKKSSCPLCGYRISFDEVECKLPCNWLRRYRRNEPDSFKVVERLASIFQGSMLFEIICIIGPSIFLKVLLHLLLQAHDKRRGAFLAGILRAEEEKKIKENRKRFADNKVLKHFRCNF